MRGESEVPSRTTLHPHLRAHSLLNVQPPAQPPSPSPPSDGSKTPPSLTQPRSYLASRTPRNPHADAHFRDLRFSDMRPVPFVGCLFTGSERRREVGNDVDGTESRHRVADTTPQISSTWSGFAVRTDWRSSDPSTARRRPTFSPSSCRN